jgi:hypothetical protein
MATLSPMAVLHEATITPTKDELVGPWLRTRRWWDGIDERGPVGSFRLDDPAGEVGMECFLFGSAEGSTLFVPVTYRGAELAGADAHLIGTMQHSVLGDRWVYDGCADPVFVATLAATILTGASQAEQEVHAADGTVSQRAPTVRAHGTGTAGSASTTVISTVAPVDEERRTLIDTDGATLAVARQVGADLPSGPALVGSYAGGDDQVLATLT